MAEEFQTGICGEAWWINPTRSSSSLSPCNSAAGFGLSDHHMGSFLWSSCDLLDMKTTSATKTKSCEESNNSVSADSSSNMVFQKQTADSDSGGSSSIFIDSTLQITNFAPSPSYSTDWNLGGNGRAENNYRSMMLEDLNSQIQKEWSPKNFTSAGDQDFSLFGGFPVNSASYGHTSALLQSCFEADTQPAGLQQSPYNNNNLCTANCGTNYSNYELSPSSWPKFAAPFLKPSMPKQQQSSGLHFSGNTHFWNSSAASDSRPGLLATVLGEKRTCTPIFTSKSHREEVRDSGSAAKKGSSEPAFKRPRIETPSPLPTFKVRKEKLGDRITALQQLVSPFGKTDTASVLHEAIEYIKFLHDQVSVLTTPYMKQGTQIPQQQSCDHKQDLKSRGLCLAPISSTFPVANETTADFWTPTFGATFS